MINKRRAERRAVDLGIRKIVDGEPFSCRACEISPTGIRLSLNDNENTIACLVELELPLVEGQLNTQITARRVWCNTDFEAFEFVGATFAQQAILERVFCNY